MSADRFSDLVVARRMMACQETEARSPARVGWLEDIDRLIVSERRVAAERGLVDQLLALLTKPCNECRAPATRSQPYKDGRWACDEHADKTYGSVYYHRELRALLAARKETP